MYSIGIAGKLSPEGNGLWIEVQTLVDVLRIGRIVFALPLA